MKHIVQSFFAKHKKTAVFVIVFTAVASVIVYIPKCVTTKVCGASFIDRIVRDSMEIVAPRGVITAEVVDTIQSRELGLSWRKGMKDGHGMLFVFPFSGKYGFWMKDMRFPIDMVWINGQGVVVYVVENALPEDFPKQYVNGPDALYVLELNANKAREYGIYLGVKLDITGQK